jgi:hypothetical protein
MDSDADEFFRVLFRLLHFLGENVELVVWTIVGLLFLASIWFCFSALRSVLRGGQFRSSQHFFAERREIARYLEDR